VIELDTYKQCILIIIISKFSLTEMYIYTLYKKED